jgi:hypothetical protein
MRLDVFRRAGGFSTDFREPSIEDIELGRRLTRDGARLRLVPEIQVMHLKAWTLTSMIRTDVLARALPWARLVLRERTLPDDLNLSHAQRLSGLVVVAMLVAFGRAACAQPAALLIPPFVLSVVAVTDRAGNAAKRSRDPALSVAAGALVLGVWAIVGRVADPALGAALLAATVTVALNGRWYAFLVRERGWSFAILTVPLLCLYHAYSTLAFMWVWLEFSRTAEAGRSWALGSRTVRRE